MADDQAYPSIIVVPPPGAYQHWSAGGGEVKIFADVEATRTAMVQACDKMKSYLEDDQRGSPAVGLARLKLRGAALAKSHRPTSTFSQDTCPIIGDLGEPGELLVLVHPQGLDRLRDRIVSLQRRDGARLTSVETFTLLDEERRFPSAARTAITNALQQAGRVRVKVRLPSAHLFTDVDQAELERTLSNVGIGVADRPYLRQGDFVVYGVTVRSFAQVQAISALDFVNRLELMPTYRTTSLALATVANKLQLEGTGPFDDLPVVAVVDSGIDSSGPLGPLIYDRESFVPPTDIDYEHGTAVAALAAAQDGVVGSMIKPRCRLLDVTIFPANEALDEDVVLRRIESALENHAAEVRVWNCSFAQDTGPKPTAFSDLAKEFDALQRRYGVMFDYSPGNCEGANLRVKWPPDPGVVTSDWVAAPGDAVRGITVGSCTPDDSPEDALAPKGAPSPFTPRGPVAHSVIKPDIVAVGGNLLADLSSVIGVASLGVNGTRYVNVGTSLSTPQVSGSMAELAACISLTFPAADPFLLAKALLLHHAMVPNVLPLGFQPSDFYGYGKLAPLRGMLEDEFWRSTSIVCAPLSPGGGDLVIDDFPYPPGLSGMGRFAGQLLVTMVSDPVLDGSYAAEYVRSNVDVHLGVVHTPADGREEFESQIRIAQLQNGYEVSLIRDEHKWSPVKQYRSDRSLHCRGDRWRLRAGLVLRDTESEVVRNDPGRASDYSVDAVIVVTVVDPTHTVQVSNQMVQQWTIRGYTPLAIQVAPQIRSRFSTQ